MDDGEKLLIPGFAGHLLAEELTFIKSELRKSSSLRRQWGFRPNAKQLNEDYIRYVAMYGVPKDRKPVLASLRKRGKKLAIH
jgi:hypothetical protein